MPCQFSNIVATQTLTSQSSPLSEVAIYTPTSAGLFRVSIYMEAPTTNTDGAPTVYWTDSYRSKSANLTNLQFTSGVPTPSSHVFWSGSGQAISISTVFDVNSGTATYNLYVVVEQLI